MLDPNHAVAQPGVTHPGDLVPLSGARVFSAWTLDVPMAVVVGALAAAYLLGVLRLRRRGEPWPVGRAVCFFLGLLAIVILTMSFIGVYETTLMWVRALQNIALMMIAPLALGSGAPISLLVATTGWPGRLVLRVIRSRPMAVLGHPLVVSFTVLISPFVLYLTPWNEESLRNGIADQTLHLVLLTLGGFYYWTRLRLDPVPHQTPHIVSVWIGFAEGIADGTLGLLLILGHTVAPHYYHELALQRHWGPSVYWDQVWGGGILLFGGDITSIPFLAALWRRLRSEDTEREREREALLQPIDDPRPSRRAAVNAGSTEPDPLAESQQLYRPWWETDPVLGSRYGHRSTE